MDGTTNQRNHFPNQDVARTVLVVEDQQDVREFIVAALSSFGYQALQSGNASDALQLVQRDPHCVDLVLTDVVMPNGDGRQLAARLKELRPGIQILFMSGYARDIMATNGILEEHADFIEKPFSLVELAAKVREMLRRP